MDMLLIIDMLLAVHTHTHTRERHDGVLCVLILDCGGKERKKCKLKEGMYVNIKDCRLLSGSMRRRLWSPQSEGPFELSLAPCISGSTS